MVEGLLGKKVGVSQIFDSEGRHIGVTLLEVGPCVVLGIKKVNSSKRVVLGWGQIKEKRVKKPQAGFFKKIGVKPVRFIKEFPIDEGDEFKIGDFLRVEIFKDITYVDVQSRTKGRGFAGGMKRWNWRGQPASHGSTIHRKMGSAGGSTEPARVFKGHHMPGHYGDELQTAKNLKIVSIDPENNLLVLKGSVPGARDSLVVVRRAKKTDRDKIKR